MAFGDGTRFSIRRQIFTIDSSTSFFVKHHMIVASRNLIVLTSAFLIVVAFNTVVLSLYIATSRGDVRTINSLGIIRGSIQRSIKLELNGINSDQVISEVDSRLMRFVRQEKRIIPVFQTDEILEDANNLVETWTVTKDAIVLYREKKSDEARSLLLEQSERCWRIANQTVLEAQVITEQRKRDLRILYLGGVVNAILAIIIIVQLRLTVRNKLEVLANYDPLTGAANRATMDTILSKSFQRYKRYARPHSVIMLDIDHFKRINDTYGHKTGDAVLKEMIRIIQDNLRETDVIARIGGEEFLIHAPETDGQQALKLAEKLRSCIEQTDFAGVGRVTVSMGIAEFQGTDTTQMLIQRADTALYQAKAQGRNQTRLG